MAEQIKFGMRLGVQVKRMGTEVTTILGTVSGVSPSLTRSSNRISCFEDPPTEETRFGSELFPQPFLSDCFFFLPFRRFLFNRRRTIPTPKTPTPTNTAVVSASLRRIFKLITGKRRQHNQSPHFQIESHILKRIN